MMDNLILGRIDLYSHNGSEIMSIISTGIKKSPLKI